MTGGGGNKKRFRYCFDSSGTILYFRALQGHSESSLIDFFRTTQCHYPGRFLQVYLSRRMCNQLIYIPSSIQD